MKLFSPTSARPGLRGKNVVRAALVAIVAVSQALIWWPSVERSPWSDSDATRSLVVMVSEGARYGAALVSIDGSTPMSVAVAARELLQSIRRNADKIVVLQVSGGVRQGDFEQLRDAVLQATGDSQAAVSVVFVDSQLRVSMP